MKKLIITGALLLTSSLNIFATASEENGNEIKTAGDHSVSINALQIQDLSSEGAGFFYK